MVIGFLPCSKLSSLYTYDASRRLLAHRRRCYSSECVEGEFSEVHGSKQPIRRSGNHSTTACAAPRLRQTAATWYYSLHYCVSGVATHNIDARVEKGSSRYENEVHQSYVSTTDRWHYRDMSVFRSDRRCHYIGERHPDNRRAGHLLGGACLLRNT